MIKILGKRIGDCRFIRLIRKFLTQVTLRIGNTSNLMTEHRRVES